MLKIKIPALEPLRWPEPLARLDPSSRMLVVALAISVVLHAVVLSLHFRFPDARKLGAPNALEVVLVNSKSRQRPVKPDVLAQANLDGGGNTDENRRAKTPLPVLSSTEPGAEAKQMQRRQRELEERQQQLLAQVKPQVPPVVADTKPQPQSEPQRSGLDLARSALALARMEAQIARNIDEYNKRPRKQFVGARAAEYRFAQYVEDWRQKIERIGNLNYPEGARGKIYGSLRLAVSINPDGSLAGLDLERSSGHKVLDAAAERIVQMAAPFSSFPPDIRRDTDILVITRTWHFASGDKIFSE